MLTIGNAEIPSRYFLCLRCCRGQIGFRPRGRVSVILLDFPSATVAPSCALVVICSFRCRMCWRGSASRPSDCIIPKAAPLLQSPPPASRRASTLAASTHARHAPQPHQPCPSSRPRQRLRPAGPSFGAAGSAAWSAPRTKGHKGRAGAEA